MEYSSGLIVGGRVEPISLPLIPLEMPSETSVHLPFMSGNIGDFAKINEKSTTNG